MKHANWYFCSLFEGNFICLGRGKKQQNPVTFIPSMPNIEYFCLKYSRPLFACWSYRWEQVLHDSSQFISSKPGKRYQRIYWNQIAIKSNNRSRCKEKQTKPLCLPLPVRDWKKFLAQATHKMASHTQGRRGS